MHACWSPWLDRPGGVTPLPQRSLYLAAGGSRLRNLLPARWETLPSCWQTGLGPPWKWATWWREDKSYGVWGVRMKVWIEMLTWLLAVQHLTNPRCDRCSCWLISWLLLVCSKLCVINCCRVVCECGFAVCNPAPGMVHKLDAVTSHMVFIQLLGWRRRVPIADRQNMDVKKMKD